MTSTYLWFIAKHYTIASLANLWPRPVYIKLRSKCVLTYYNYVIELKY